MSTVQLHPNNSASNAAGTAAGASNVVNLHSFKDIIGAADGDASHVLGKFLYFSLHHLLIEKAALADLCDGLGIAHSTGKRLSVADAFRSATGDIRERIVSTSSGETKIYMVYCRDNERSPDMYSRELVKETLNQHTNQYQKLANIRYDKTDRSFGWNDIQDDPDVDVLGLCQRAGELFELYQRCSNRRQIETICLGFLNAREATKVCSNGHLFFVPRHYMGDVDVFESFIEALVPLNLAKTPLTVNSFYIIDDARQRDKMTEEFYLAVKKEIAEYQERADYLIKSGSSSPAIMERWVVKIANLEEKKRHYEEILRRELTGLDEDFEGLQLLSQELTLRARGLRAKKAA
ncbi:MAG: hypothetical protein J6X53_01410 [Abditibacteriota bacterium]|nr:hypothetical protein [Abditibacteriota bacterium]